MVSYKRKHESCCRVGTESHVVPVKIGDETILVDACVADIVLALNNGGIRTKAACCGHGTDGNILLEDGRNLEVYLDKDTPSLVTKIWKEYFDTHGITEPPVPEFIKCSNGRVKRYEPGSDEEM